MIFEIYSTINSIENLSRGSRNIPFGERMAGKTEKRKLIVALRNFANAPN